MAVGATHLELYVIGAISVGVLAVLSFMFTQAAQVQGRNGKKVRGEKLL